MADKKIQENPLPEYSIEPKVADKPKEIMKPVEKLAMPVTIPTDPVPRTTVPTFSKNQPNDLHRRLLPAVLFLLTFVTVMTMLLIYMDAVAVGAQQFRVNMTRDYELERIPQASGALVAYVRQLHLQPPRRAPASGPPPPTRTASLLAGETEHGTFLEFMASGPRDPTTLYLELARGWTGAVVRAAPRDYLSLRTTYRTIHACLSPVPYPREVTFPEWGEGGSVVSRVLCLPLYTCVLAADAMKASLVVLAAPAADILPALKCVPFDNKDLELKVLDIRTTDKGVLRNTTEFLATKNYSILDSSENGTVYKLNPLKSSAEN